MGADNVEEINSNRFDSAPSNFSQKNFLPCVLRNPGELNRGSYPGVSEIMFLPEKLNDGTQGREIVANNFEGAKNT